MDFGSNLFTLNVAIMFDSIKKWLYNQPRKTKKLNLKKRLKNMTTTTKTEVNYTPEMVAILKANAPLDFAKAEALSKQLGRNVRSIIAKAKREGVNYISKPAPAKKKAAPSKMDMVAAICKGLNMDSCEGLDKATGSALATLLANIK